MKRNCPRDRVTLAPLISKRLDSIHSISTNVQFIFDVDLLEL